MIDASIHSTRWFLVDLTIPGAPAVSTSRDDDQEMAATLATEIAEGWAPWTGLPATDYSLIDIGEIPSPVRTIAARHDWRRVTLAPVAVDGRLAAVYVSFARVPSGYPLLELKSNVRGRTRESRRRDEAVVLEMVEPRPTRAGGDQRHVEPGSRTATHLPTPSSRPPRSALLYIDIDEFKGINDEFGHEIGDRVLRSVAERIRGACRPVDLVARFGGDEFVALLDGASSTDAVAVANRIIGLTSSPLDIDGGPDRVHVSVGVATIDDADDALRAKNAINAAITAMRGEASRGSRVITADE